ncbi:MAG: Xaa-Pro dipeptidase [Blastocatellia bacterium]
MQLAELYQEHIAKLKDSYTTIINELSERGLNLDGVLIHSGSEGYYFADDNHIAFRSVPHFTHWLALEGADHFLLFQPNKPLKLFRYVPKDFWYETPVDAARHWQSEFEITEVNQVSEISKYLPNLSQVAYIGNNASLVQEWGLSPELVQPKSLMSRLDFARAIKTPYEVHCIKLANQRAACGHRAALAAFQAGLSEREIHRDYLNAIDGAESDTPYTNIVALNEKAAVLHYQHKRGREAANGDLLLIDAGAKMFGYCSDITRTYLREGADDVFQELLNKMESLQQALVAQVKVGLSYIDIHRATHQGVAKILAELELIKLSADEIFARGFTHPFFPHGIGHLLGIQVHDVSGHVADKEGTPAPPPAEYRFLRFTRVIEAGQVFTIEPGFYFIPMLLEPYRNGEDKDLFNWAMIDRLSKFGGIRIEDNIHVRVEGPENLTRAVLT